MNGQTYRQTDVRTDGRTERSEIFCKGGKKVVFMMVALMSFLTIGGTNVMFLAIGGTYVDLIEGGTNVSQTNVGRTNVGGRKVAASMLSIKYIFFIFCFLFHYF